MYNLGCEEVNVQNTRNLPQADELGSPLGFSALQSVWKGGVFSFPFLSLARLFQASEQANICHTDM